MNDGILFYIDRFGLPGDYRVVWLKLLSQSSIPTMKATALSLHKLLGGNLLQPYRNRKAPTWNERREDEIRARIKADITKHRPKVIVLSSPEALVVTGLDPEYATLFKLRGAVYDVYGVPALVTLPISAWRTQVSTKEIGGANFGIDDPEQFDLLQEARLASAGAGDAEGDDDEERAESSDTAETWYEPVIVPVGKFMLQSDYRKLGRIFNNRQGEFFDA